MNIAPLIAAVICFTVAAVALLRPNSVRSWMRRNTRRARPSTLQEYSYKIAPPVFAAAGIAFGIISIVAFVAER